MAGGGIGRFNGAAAMVPRKTIDLRGIRTTGGDLLQWGRGDGAAEDASGRLDCESRGVCFNGAAAMVPRKTRNLVARVSSLGVLQWGRGDGAAEDVATAAEYLPTL